jgi:type I restriction enzyme M protein
MNQDIQKTLWAAADKLRSNMDAAEYKHVVLGLIFLKYISDSFDERRVELKAAFADPRHERYIGDESVYKEFWIRSQLEPGRLGEEALRANGKG